MLPARLRAFVAIVIVGALISDITGTTAYAAEAKLYTSALVRADFRALWHPKGIQSVAWSADGKRLATSGDAPSVYVWDVESAVLLKQLYRAGQWWPLAFTKDGRLVTSAAGLLPGAAPPAVSVWDITTDQIVDQVPGAFPDRPLRSNAARFLTISRQGDLLAFVGPDIVTDVHLVEVLGWRSLAAVPPESGSPTAIELSPDGTLLAVGTTRGRIVLFDVNARKQLKVIDAYGEFRSSVRSLAFSPDGKLIASGPGIPMVSRRLSDGSIFALVPPDPIRIWNTSNGTLDRSMNGEFGAVYSLSWSVDGKHLASASGDHLGRIWNLYASISTSTTVAKFEGVPYAVAFSPDGSKVAVIGDNLAVIGEIPR